MTKRRSISVRGLTHQRIKDYADATNRSCSSVLEQWVHERLDELGVPMPDTVSPTTPRPAPRPKPAEKKAIRNEAVSKFFTF